MFDGSFSRRKVVALTALVLLAGCKVIPRSAPVSAPPPVANVVPNANTLPADQQRHRVALLVPLTGVNAAVGQSLANATTMALLDTNAANLRITTYDTATGAGAAAARAIADGNKLILGPLMSDDVALVTAAARPAHVPLISFSNDSQVAARDVFLMGLSPNQSISRTIEYARAHGVGRFAALIPTGLYGERAGSAFQLAVREAGGSVSSTETYDRGNTSVTSAAHRLQTRGGYDAVLLADGARLTAQAAPLLRATAASPRLLGTELWSGESAITTIPALRGAWFSAVSDGRWKQFSDSYRARFAVAPRRISTLGYDAVLLALNVARSWRPGTPFPTAKLSDRGGFLGLDGPFRFGIDGVAERALEVREVRVGGITVVSPAPARFGD